jgi:hypothetical protein
MIRDVESYNHLIFFFCKIGPSLEHVLLTKPYILRYYLV